MEMGPDCGVLYYQKVKERAIDNVLRKNGLFTQVIEEYSNILAEDARASIAKQTVDLELGNLPGLKGNN